jgi:HK97 family phage portal protein
MKIYSKADQCKEVSEYLSKKLHYEDKKISEVKEYISKQVAFIQNNNVKLFTKGVNIWESLTEFGTGNLPGTKVSDLRLLSAYINNDVVYTCAELNASAVAGTPYHLYTELQVSTLEKQMKGLKKFKQLTKKQKIKLQKEYKYDIDEENEVIEIKKHKILDLLNKTNENLNGFDILRLTDIYLEVFGRAYWLKEFNNSGELESFKVLRSYYVYPLRDYEGLVIGWMYLNVMNKGQHETIFLDKDEVIDFRMPSASDPYAGGTSWVRAAFDKIQLSAKFVEYQNWLFDNKCRPDYIIQPTSENPNPDELARLERYFTDKLKGWNNGKPLAIMEAVKVTPLNFAPAEVAPLEINKELIKSVASSAMVPVDLIMGQSTYQNIEQAMKQWKEIAIKSRTKVIENAWNIHICALPEFIDNQLFICFEEPSDYDDDFDLNKENVRNTKLKMAIDKDWIKPNELREELGLDPIEEEIKEDDKTEDVEEDERTGSIKIPYKEERVPTELDRTQLPSIMQPQTKHLDIDNLISLNKLVSKGVIDRATAINILTRVYELEDIEAKNLITPKIKKDMIEGVLDAPISIPTVPNIEDKKELKDIEESSESSESSEDIEESSESSEDSEYGSDNSVDNSGENTNG